MTDNTTTPVASGTVLASRTLADGSTAFKNLLTDVNGADPLGQVGLPAPGTVLALLIAILADAAAIAAIGTETYSLASSLTLAAGASGPTIIVPRGGYFFLDATFVGTSPSLKLQRLGADNLTWLDVVARTTPGSGDPVGIPSGSSLRVTNASAGALTAVSAVLG